MEGAPCIDVGGDVAPRVGTSANQCLRRPFGETSLRYAPHPGAPHTGNMDPGQLGNVLPNGEDYRSPRDASDDGAVVGRVRRRKSSFFEVYD